MRSRALVLYIRGLQVKRNATSFPDGKRSNGAGETQPQTTPMPATKSSKAGSKSAQIKPSNPSEAAGAQSGMGAIPFKGGTAFRVWAPHAESVSVIGTFNSFKDDADHLKSEGNGYWYGEAGQAKAGDEYKYIIEVR